MRNTAPARPMLARQNDDGVSVNESSVCAGCLYDDQALESSREYWANAEDVTDPDNQDDTLSPADNPDGICNGCGATALEEGTTT